MNIASQDCSYDDSHQSGTGKENSPDDQAYIGFRFTVSALRQGGAALTAKTEIYGCFLAALGAEGHKSMKLLSAYLRKNWLPDCAQGVMPAHKHYL
jgi:hypothetical protein